jgi:transcriptional regulator with XRE-family HTH domain
MKLNKIIKQLQQDSGMNQRDFAKYYGISYSTLNQVITNENRCGIDFFEKVLIKMNLTYHVEIIEA